MAGKLKKHPQSYVVKPAPEKLALLPYQAKGVAFLTELRGGLLGDSPGVGKTPQLLKAAENMREGGKILYLTLASIKRQTSKEVGRFTDMSAVCITGTPAQRRSLWETRADVYVANYELLLSPLDMLSMHKLAPTVIICDEATRLSNVSGKQYKVLRKLSAAHPKAIRIASTGTPVSNVPTDIYGILDWVFPNCLGSWIGFMTKFVVFDGMRRPLYFRNLKDLAEKIKPFFIRRTIKDVLSDIPPVRVKQIEFDLSPTERKLYDLVRLGAVMAIPEGELNVKATSISNRLTRAIRLCQVADSLELVSDKHKGSSKTDRLMELLDEILPDKVIIYSKFSSYARLIHKAVNMRHYPLLITGETPNPERDDILKRFNGSDRYKVLVITDAAAMGLNLQEACHHLVFADLPWSVSKYVQILGRIRRIGQKFPMVLYEVMGTDTVDYKVKQILEKKKGYVDMLLGEEVVEDYEVKADELDDIML